MLFSNFSQCIGKQYFNVSPKLTTFNSLWTQHKQTEIPRSSKKLQSANVRRSLDFVSFWDKIIVYKAWDLIWRIWEEEEWEWRIILQCHCIIGSLVVTNNINVYTWHSDVCHHNTTCSLTRYIYITRACWHSISGPSRELRDEECLYTNLLFSIQTDPNFIMGSLAALLSLAMHQEDRLSLLQIKHPLLHNKWLRRLAMDANKLQLMQTIEQFQLEHFIVCSTP